MSDKELIEQARQTVALITSYTKDTDWAKRYPLKYGLFQQRAEKLNEALREHRFDWDKEINKN